MTKGTRYTPEFRVKAVRLLTESRSSYSPETKAKSAGGERPGRGPGDAAPLVQPGGRDGHGGDEAIGAGSDGRARETAPGGRRVVSGERDIDDGVGFFRGQARPDTPLMVAYVDEHKGRFEVGPICRGLSESLDCGFIMPRDCRMFKNRPVSRMAARHEDYLDAVAEELNNWPRKTLGYMKPSEKNIELLDSTN